MTSPGWVAHDDTSANARDEVTFSGSFNRPEGLANIRYEWDFGDGSAPATGEVPLGATTVSASHRYPDGLPYPYMTVLTIGATARWVRSKRPTGLKSVSSGSWRGSGGGMRALRACGGEQRVAVVYGVGALLMWVMAFSILWVPATVRYLWYLRRQRRLRRL